MDLAGSKRGIFPWVVAAWVLLCALTQTVADSPQIVRGPYLQLGTSGRITVCWRTDVATDSRVVIGPSPGSLNTTFVQSGSRVDHALTIPGLSADTRYYYAVGTNAQLLAGDDSAHFFEASPATGTAEPTRIWVLGDSGTGNAGALAVRDAYYAFTGLRHTDLWLMLGDNAYPSGTDADYQAKLFQIFPVMLRKSVLWPALGNHDLVSADSTTQTGPYFDIFRLPAGSEAGGQASGTEAYYSFDYANIHFVVLDSLDTDRSVDGAMLTWLEQDLGSTVQDWIIAYWHHPPYSKGSHDSDLELPLVEMRQNVVPILDGHGVDLTLTGHSHSYERSFLITGFYSTPTTIPSEGSILDSGNGRPAGDGAYEKLFGPDGGTVHTVAGSAGQTSGGALNHPLMFTSLNTLGSLVLDVHSHRLEATFLGSTGAVEDSFTIIKGCAVGDEDAEGICDDVDNCPAQSNPDQNDGDGDGVGDVCDAGPADPTVCRDVDGDGCDDCSSGLDDVANDGPDADSDGVCDGGDNCLGVPNPDQLDLDGDTEGDACDLDDDNDGVPDGPADPARLDPDICGDVDGDGCDDCSVGTDDLGPLPDVDPFDDGPDHDGDGLCDPGDPDDDDDGVGDEQDSDPIDGSVCRDSDSDSCDDCSSGVDDVSNDGPDAEGDGICDAGDNCSGVANPAQENLDGDAQGDACDLDDDNDGVPDGPGDPERLDPDICGDVDGDTCDDCSVGTDDLGPLPDTDPSNDGADFEGDGLCDAGDSDDDNDGVEDTLDDAAFDPHVCRDADADTCDDCTGGTDDALNDGLDTDGDGICNAGDLDDDNDGVADVADDAPFDPTVCRDADGDGCDDCSSGTDDPSNDGLDTDEDGICNAADFDDDNDGVADVVDADPVDPTVCRDVDGDSCDDCSSGTDDTSNDGLDTDEDGICNATDLDDDDDGVADVVDADPVDPTVCRDADGDSCDDCSSGTDDTSNDGPDADGDGICNAGDNCFGVPNPGQENLDGDAQGDACDLDDDNDGVPDGPGDPARLDPDVCGDVDADTCDDCSVGTDDLGPLPDVAPSNDGLDTDADGICDAGDLDNDNDGVDDAVDDAPFDPTVCRDADGDSCDDCSSGTDDTSNDGLDTDEDGICNAADLDDDDDGVADVVDADPVDPTVCRDADGDSCDDCSSGMDDASNDGPDADGDGICNAGDNCFGGPNPGQENLDGDAQGDACDRDDDNDGVPDGPGDPARLDPDVCGDVDADTCDDCSVGTDDLGPLSDADPSNDGADLDGDGLCDAGDADVDGDGVDDGSDADPLDPNTCRDVDADSCDDCSSGSDDPSSDGADFDGDGLCDAGDADDDNDGVEDTQDNAPMDPVACRDVDEDLCDDCTSGVDDPANDGPDFDGDGLCDLSDFDQDADGVPDSEDSHPDDATRCRDADADTCDDCASGTDNPAADGPDLDGDGLCDLGDGDDDNDGVADGEDIAPLDPLSCLDLDGDTCDDCSNGALDSQNDGFDTDGDGLCDAGDGDDDNDGFPDVEDCAPRDDEFAIAPPKVEDLIVGGSAATTLSWSDVQPGTRYDLVSGSLADLGAGDGQLEASCIADDSEGSSVADTRSAPPAGQGYFYLVRAQHGCSGSYGAADSGEERLAVDDCSSGSLTAFVTSTKFRGDFGGIGAADAICNQLASVAGLSGAYRAWLSDASHSPSSSFQRGQTQRYVRVDGVVVADNWDDLTDGGLFDAIQVNEHGVQSGIGSNVWTGTEASGAAVINNRCEEWTSTLASGWQGRPVGTAANWTKSGLADCTKLNRLYCFQQP